MSAIKTSVFIATSLDGFIARLDGGLDWLDAANRLVPDGEDCGYRTFIDTVDVLVMGRHSFEKVLGFGAWPYGQLPVVVMSRGGVDIPGELRPTVTSSSQAPGDLLATLRNKGYRHAYIDGGLTIQSFLSAGLVDEIIMTLIPVLLGNGISLFGELQRDIWLEAVETKRYPFGFNQLRYRVNKGGID
jgi:dihydrofolate reductase